LSIGAPEENRLKAGQHAKSAKKLKCAILNGEPREKREMAKPEEQPQIPQMKAGGNGEAGCGSLVVSLGSVGLTSAQFRLS
jgi:hypothetical protein